MCFQVRCSIVSWLYLRQDICHRPYHDFCLLALRSISFWWALRCWGAAERAITIKYGRNIKLTYTYWYYIYFEENHQVVCLCFIERRYGEVQGLNDRWGWRGGRTYLCGISANICWCCDFGKCKSTDTVVLGRWFICGNIKYLQYRSRDLYIWVAITIPEK